MKTINIRNRKIELSKSLIDLFEEVVCCPLGEMAELYLAATLKKSDITEDLNKMTDADIFTAIRPWIKAEFDMAGVKHEEI